MPTNSRLVDSESILKFTQRVVRNAASTGECVIVGRGSQHFLENHPETLRVFLYAPREEKMQPRYSRGHTEKEAEELVDTVDRDRVDFIQKYFGVEWPSRSLYHLMLNTSSGEQTVVQAILDFTNTLRLQALIDCSQLRQRAHFPYL